MTLIQVGMSMAAGGAVVVLLYTGLGLWFSHRTVSDKILVWGCCVQSILIFGSSATWYFCVYLRLMDTFMYHNEYTRCLANSANRKCWGLGPGVIVAFVVAAMYVVAAFFQTCVEERKMVRFKVCHVLCRIMDLVMEQQ